jgi:hypothetical protein
MKNLNEEIKKIRLLIEYSKGDSSVMEKEYKLYVDMGGVLFTKMGADEGGLGDKTEYIGNKLWEGIKKYEPTILSATGSKNVDNSIETKRNQVKVYLEPIPPIKFVVLGKDKGKEYANENSILIDDSQTNIDSWVNNGGIGIKHSSDNVAKTLDKLKSIMEK